MKRLNPEKLYVTYLSGTSLENLVLPRRYTLTHSDRTGKLYLSIGPQYDTRQTSSLYTRLMRDEVLAEFASCEEGLVFRVYFHVSGGLTFGPAKWRYAIFQSELRLVLESIRYGDRALFEQNPHLDSTPVLIQFNSRNKQFNKVENWHTISEYW